MFLTLKLVGI
uniref:Uncharacterized protein n=1 Tax=Arundo donax TaxID=35708 RepID=A0A0A9AGJ7_ARUDO